jgi:hypothetical protein
MRVFETDLELLQFTADTRFGGDIDALAVALEKLEIGLEKDKHFYRRVGNQCIVWAYRTDSLRVCEENPDKLQGVFITDYDPTIQKGSLIIGSVLSGCSEVIRDSQIRGSNLIGSSYIAKSSIFESRISGGPIWNSKIDRSYISASVRNSELQSCLAVVGQINGETKSYTEMQLNPNKDIISDLNPAHGVLVRRGINIATDWNN